MAKKKVKIVVDREYRGNEKMEKVFKSIIENKVLEEYKKYSEKEIA